MEINDTKEQRGLFKVCAGCSHLKEQLGPNEEQYYCSMINEYVHYSRDAMDCKFFDGKNVIIQCSTELPSIVFE